MTILENFGLKELAEGFKKPGGIHLPWNLLTLEPNLHNFLDDLELWFERTNRVRHSETSKLR